LGFIEVKRTPGKENHYRLLRCETKSVDKLIRLVTTRV
jgi:hypothetical protein